MDPVSRCLSFQNLARNRCSNKHSLPLVPSPTSERLLRASARPLRALARCLLVFSLVSLPSSSVSLPSSSVPRRSSRFLPPLSVPVALVGLKPCQNKLLLFTQTTTSLHITCTGIYGSLDLAEEPPITWPEIFYDFCPPSSDDESELIDLSLPESHQQRLPELEKESLDDFRPPS
eukprot:IDg21325t1